MKNWNLSHWTLRTMMPIGIGTGFGALVYAERNNDDASIQFFYLIATICLIVCDVQMKGSEDNNMATTGFQKTSFVFACIFTALFMVGFLEALL